MHHLTRLMGIIFKIMTMKTTMMIMLIIKKMMSMTMRRIEYQFWVIIKILSIMA